MTTRKEELKKEIEYLKERCLGVGVNVLKAELKGIQEGKADKEKEILEIIEGLKIKTNRNVYEPLSQEQKSWNCVLEELKSKIKGAGK